MIKLYRKTFIISCCISITAFALSIVFECFRGQVNEFSFFESYAIGIACSGLLIAITSFLQFQAEYNNALCPLSVALSDLVFLLYSGIIFADDPTSFEREYDPVAYEQLRTAIGRACKGNYIICLSKKRQKAFEELSAFLFLLRDSFTREKSREDAVQVVADPNRVLKLIDLSLKVLPDGVEKEEIYEKKVELGFYLDELSKRKVKHHDQL